MITEAKVTELLCIADNFCKFFLPTAKEHKKPEMNTEIIDKSRLISQGLLRTHVIRKVKGELFLDNSKF